jgi:hypothetical protein
MTGEEVGERLSALFEPREVKWKPQSVKGNRAMAIAYIDCRVIQDRLDEVMGVENWQDGYEIVPDGSVVCRLAVRINGEWVTKTDVGSPSEQPDGGDRLKAAFSDALKRAAVKYGIGRYIYRLPNQWVDYDPQKRQFVSTPQLPAWAIPKANTPMPAAKADPYTEPPPVEPKPAKAAKTKPKTLAELYAALNAAPPPTAETFGKYVVNASTALMALIPNHRIEELTDSLISFLKLPAADPIRYEFLKPPQVESGWNHCKQFVKRLADTTPKE